MEKVIFEGAQSNDLQVVLEFQLIRCYRVSSLWLRLLGKAFPKPSLGRNARKRTRPQDVDALRSNIEPLGYRMRLGKAYQHV